MSLTIGICELVKYERQLLREQQDADREDDRDDAGLVDPQRQERLAALVHPPAADAAGVLDRDPPLAFLDVDDHGDRDDRQDARRARRRARLGFARNPLTADGARLTMPAKMMKLMPLPMPFSVISSPSHIRTIAPAISVNDLDQVVEVGEVEPAGHDAARVEQREEAVGLQQGHRDGQVAGVLVELLAPELTLAAERLERRDHALHQLHDDRGVDVRVHGQRRRPRSVDSPPPENRSSIPNSGFLSKNCASWVLSMPGQRHGASRRKTISSPRTYRIRRRISGARNAFSRDSNTDQASPGGLGVVDAVSVTGASSAASLASALAAFGARLRLRRAWRPSARRLRARRRRPRARPRPARRRWSPRRRQPPAPRRLRRRLRARRPCRPSPWACGLVGLGLAAERRHRRVGTSRTFTEPPAASILARADSLNASATTKSGGRRSRRGRGSSSACRASARDRPPGGSPG